MAEMHFTVFIQRPQEEVFSLIADLANYDAWLSPSSLYKSQPTFSDNPIKLGTIYTDVGQAMPLRGEVTEFEPPNRITFRQGTQIKRFGITGALDIQIRYTLGPMDDGTRVDRDTTVRVGGILGLFETVLLSSIKRENERILGKMKAWLENVPEG
jgi:carbon monoxide dehydrogenase subunit G